MTHTITIEGLTEEEFARITDLLRQSEKPDQTHLLKLCLDAMRTYNSAMFGGRHLSDKDISFLRGLTKELNDMFPEQ
tara:strand:- start:532 stop:762 length:231 start_codon:yes stop_codon:yes gene_type:complete